MCFYSPVKRLNFEDREMEDLKVGNKQSFDSPYAQNIEQQESQTLPTIGHKTAMQEPEPTASKFLFRDDSSSDGEEGFLRQSDKFQEQINQIKITSIYDRFSSEEKDMFFGLNTSQ